MADRVFLPCGRCGLVIEVTDPEVIPQVGVRPVEVFHDACVEPTPLRRFVVKVGVAELVIPADPPGLLRVDLKEGDVDALRQRLQDRHIPAMIVEGDTEVSIVPVEEDLIGFSANAEAESFVAALVELERQLGQLWLRVVEHAPIVDGYAEPPTTTNQPAS